MKKVLQRIIRPGFSLLVLVVLLSLSGCSWKEYFVVSNIGNSEIVVQYKVKDEKKGFPIFGDQPIVYKLNSNNEIDWNSKLSVTDLDSTLTGYKLKVPPKSALIFGELSNDKYSAYNQKFINDRHFNLEQMKIEHNGSTIFILPNTFDTYFKKMKGNILLELK